MSEFLMIIFIHNSKCVLPSHLRKKIVTFEAIRLFIENTL